MRSAGGALVLATTLLGVVVILFPSRSKPGVTYLLPADVTETNAGAENEPRQTAESPLVGEASQTSSLPSGTDAAQPPLVALLTRRRTNVTTTSAADVIREAFPGQYGWVFLRYVPSKLEEDYYAAVAPYDHSNASWDKLRPAFGARFEAMNQAMRNRVVPHAPLVSTDVFKAQCKSYIQRTNSGQSDPIPSTEGGCLSVTTPLDTELFSRFEYQFVCLSPPCPPLEPAEEDHHRRRVDDETVVNNRKVPSASIAHHRVGDIHTSYIESLGGSMRHPKVFINEVTNSLRRIDWNYLFRKDYMIVDKWALNNLFHRWALPKKASHLLDLGSSTFSQGTGGASQPWFFGLADCMCVPFSTARFWEAAELKADGVWLDVPKERRPRYHWYNYPLSAEDSSWRNPLNHLLSTAAVGDVGIVKVDFEAPLLEARIIERIIELPELHLLIDELFFEHHVRNGPMQNLWQQIITKDCGCRCTMDLFRRLRQVGVRAHSWV